MTKKMLMMALVMLAMTVTSTAQTQKTLTEKQKRDAVENMLKSKMKWVNNNATRKRNPNIGYYITFLPVTWYEYWAVTGEKKHSDRTSISRAAIVLDSEQEKFVKMLNKYLNFHGVRFRVANSSQIRQAHQKVGLHDDLDNNSTGHGFYIVITNKKAFDSLMQYINMGGLGAVG